MPIIPNMSTSQKDANYTDEKGGAEKLPSRHLTDSIIVSDIESLLKEIKLEKAWDRDGHFAKTLVKYPAFRIVLIAMKKGKSIPNHKTDGEISIQVLQGHIRLQVARRVVDVAMGNLVALEKNLPHDVEAIEESAFLLSISERRKE